MAGHSHFSPANVEEHFEFTSEGKKRVIYAFIAGVVALVLGIYLLSKGEAGGHEVANAGHEAVKAGHEAASEHLSGGAVSHQPATEEHYDWTNRIWANVWLNAVFFTGIAIIGMFFVSLQYLTKSGWSSVMKRVPEAFPKFLYITLPILLLVFFFKGDTIFHWMHHGVTEVGSENYDKIIAGKSGYLNKTFFLVRLVGFFALWIGLWIVLRKKSLEEDLIGGTDLFTQMVRISTAFIVVFGASSSMFAWDWVMSIDTHWFSTMFGWYMFSSWHVTGLAVITLTILLLKDKGYMAYVNENHLHDLGKLMFAFSIFWTYVWFEQFLLIYYANMPEEIIYFLERWEGHNKIYKTSEILMVFLNFFFPFLVLMTRDAKRTRIFLKIAAFLIIVGHYIDFYQMIMPGVLGGHAGYGLVEFGMVTIFASAFIYIVSDELTKASLIAKNHPFLPEAVHHDI
ncbi:quinol:cytochrome C oxidoreductase [Aquirufa salirivi]|uniref:Quinol:cytochrome C oxidoreductase n=1 Tax=Aquirufa salirivi TaxID=3104729 RepID=A0ABW8RR89_9BACT